MALSLFAIGDLHLSMDSGKPMDVFGEHWRDHQQKLEVKWLSIVGERDIVLIPGDISWAMNLDEARRDLDWLGSLPGRKLMIKGNHDYWWSSLSKVTSVLPESLFALQNSAWSDAGLVVAGTRGWILPGSDGYCQERDGRIFARELARLELSLESAKSIRGGSDSLVVMMHYPPHNEGARTVFTRLMTEHSVDMCVYGHLHSSTGYWGDKTRAMIDGVDYVLVSADHVEFTPVRLMELEGLET